MIYKEDILKQLEAFQVAVGKPVLVHSSLKAIGEMQVQNCLQIIARLIKVFI